MPADSERRPPTPSLPHTWRPFGARIAVWVLGGLLLALVAAVWIGLGAEVRSQFTLFQRITLVVIGLMLFGAWNALVRSRVRQSPLVSRCSSAASTACSWHAPT